MYSAALKLFTYPSYVPNNRRFCLRQNNAKPAINLKTLTMTSREKQKKMGSETAVDVPPHSNILILNDDDVTTREVNITYW